MTGEVKDLIDLVDKSNKEYLDLKKVRDELGRLLPNYDLTEINKEVTQRLLTWESHRSQLDILRKNCKHTYVLAGITPYKDVYECIHCGDSYEI